MIIRLFLLLTRKLNIRRRAVLPVSVSLFRYMEGYIDGLHRLGHHRTAETYRATLNSFARFRSGEDIRLDEVDSRLMLSYETCLKEKGLCANTVVFYLKRLRVVYNQAVEEGVVNDCHPFRKVSVSSEKTVKRAVSVSVIRRLKKLDLDASPSKCKARDLFLLSFYLRGMSFVDMANLRKTDLRNGVLTYRRQKTGQLLTIRWEPCMRELAALYATPPSSPYLLSVIRDPKADVRKQIHASQTQVNRHLHDIGRTLKLPLPLTMYVARHSWASIARQEGIPVSVISEGMGHDSESTTRIYLASLEATVIDEANRKILRLL